MHTYETLRETRLTVARIGSRSLRGQAMTGQGGTNYLFVARTAPTAASCGGRTEPRTARPRQGHLYGVDQLQPERLRRLGNGKIVFPGE